MKTDGKILEYKSPIKVHQVLSEFPHHAISDKLPVIKHLHPNTEMLQGHLYYLLPLPVPPQPIKKKTTTKKAVRFSDDVLELGDGGENGVVRIKVVISKQELQAILSNGGVSVDDVISKVQKKDDLVISKGWSPALESIPGISSCMALCDP
ncbi:hypothetical protein DH2020_039880 [Rehmannia glutinosa]|uniref:Uncharacterized protein n=1 Tax=Rehmannia glutinosa TaxID=99300 RepID=A0ABR0UUL1_REHGL